MNPLILQSQFMCGILGIVSNSKVDLDINNFRSALMKMLHRGPDNQTVVAINDNVYLGHVRLSIIDLDEKSNQPFTDESGRFHLVYNGEIYNYLEIKKELITLGYKFRTQSDTEVLLTSYIAWGEECVNRFNGMWAFAIFDNANGSLFCSRDRYGIKPFYYTNIDNMFVFCSEIKPILELFPSTRRPNIPVITNYITQSINAQQEYTWFENIYRLQAATNLTADKDGVSFDRYYTYPSTPLNSGANNFLTTYKKLFHNSVKIRLRSDVPIGVTLSGGLDSSTILAACTDEIPNSISSYSIGKSGYQFDETIAAKHIADSLDLNFQRIEYDENTYMDTLRQCVYHMESGSISHAVPQYYQLIKAISKDCKVVLEGQGADEILAGYINSTYPYYILEKWKNGKFKAGIIEMFYFFTTIGTKNALYSLLKTSERINNIHNYILTVFNLNLETQILASKYRIRHISQNHKIVNLNGVLTQQHKSILQEFLHYGDALSMAFGVESRMPFLDHNLVDFTLTIPSDLKIKNGFSKWIHRYTFNKRLSKDIIWNNKKLGFPTPNKIINQNSASDNLHNIFIEKLIKREFLDKDKIRLLFSKINHTDKYNTLIYRLVSVEIWFDIFIDNNFNEFRTDK